MNVEMAYLLGMITGNGQIQRGNTETRFSVEIPHKKLETEFNNDVTVYIRASITDIRSIVEPLTGATLSFIQKPNYTILTIAKPNTDYLTRELLRYVGNATEHDNMRISPEVFGFTADERKYFIMGFADVTGYIRRSNYAYHEPQYRVYFEIPNNWDLVIDFCNLLKTVDIPVQAIDWGHPNMRDGNLIKYNEGKPDFWKKEHQVKVWALEYQKIGFNVIHKKQALDYFAELHKNYLVSNNKSVNSLHKYYWEGQSREKNKLYHPGENDSFLPIEIRGKHYNSWKKIAEDLGYKDE